MSRLLCLLVLVATMPVAMARDDIDVTQSAQAIVEQQQRIREAVVAKRNGWDEVPAEQRNAVLRDQDQVFLLLQGRQTVSELPPNQQLKVANLLESIKAAAIGAESQRKVCTRERKVGSNFSHRVCRTAGDIRKERDATRDGLQRGGLRKGMAPPVEGVR